MPLVINSLGADTHIHTSIQTSWTKSVSRNQSWVLKCAYVDDKFSYSFFSQNITSQLGKTYSGWNKLDKKSYYQMLCRWCNKINVDWFAELDEDIQAEFCNITICGWLFLDAVWTKLFDSYNVHTLHFANAACILSDPPHNYFTIFNDYNYVVSSLADLVGSLQPRFVYSPYKFPVLIMHVS